MHNNNLYKFKNIVTHMNNLFGHLRLYFTKTLSQKLFIYLFIFSEHD